MAVKRMELALTHLVVVSILYIFYHGGCASLQMAASLFIFVSQLVIANAFCNTCVYSCDRYRVEMVVV